MKFSLLLVVSRDESVLRTIREVSGCVEGVEVVAVDTLDDAYQFDSWDRTALVLIHDDRRTPTYGVIRLLRMLSAARRPIPTVILADGLDDAERTELFRLGIADLISRPFDIEKLAYIIEVMTLRARRPIVTREAGVAAVATALGESDPILAQARRVAPSKTPVLIAGEEGTGKSRLARTIHDLSPLRNGPFVTLRCATIAVDGFEEELFGPFGEPGLDGSSGGRLAEARDGTLLLDDIDALPLRAQATLLTWIEGEGRTPRRPGRPRLIASTRRDLPGEVAEGRFRNDLFYRLNVIGLHLPPLRERRGDVGGLAAEMLAELSARSAVLSPEAVAAIEAYSWPGNVRELRGVLENALNDGHGAIVGRERLPDPLRNGERGLPVEVHAGPTREGRSTLAQTKRDAEYIRINQALEKHNHNRLRTADELGISRMTLYKKLYKYGIIEQEFREGRTHGRLRPSRPGGPRPDPSTKPSLC